MMKFLLTLFSISCFIQIIFSQNGIQSIQLKNGEFIIPSKNEFNIEKYKNQVTPSFFCLQIKRNHLTQPIAKVQIKYHFVNIISDNIFISKLNINELNQALIDTQILSVFLLPAKFKISDAITEEDNLDILIKLYDLESQINFQNDFPTIAINKRFLSKSSSLFVIKNANIEVINKIAEKDYVEFIQSDINPSELIFDKHALESVNGATMSIANGGLGIEGENMIIGVGDQGFFSHIDLDDRKTNFAANGPSNHTPLVTSIINGGGFLDPLTRGIAPKSQTIVDDFFEIIENSSLYFQTKNMSVTNNSYGVYGEFCSRFGEYDAISQYIDELIEDYPQIVHVFASGNNGANNCGSGYGTGFNNVFSGPQCAKNTITVANLSKNETTSIFSGSSRGPTDDGRFKPEIGAIGNNVYGCINNNLYTSANGTSMSCPSVAAAACLVQESYKNVHGMMPRADEVKAIIINSVDDIDLEGPDYASGFGRLNVEQACRTAATNQIITDQISISEVNDFAFNVPINTSKIIVTLNWIDPPGVSSAARSLVNNLDLEVIGPGGTILPWTVSKVNGFYTLYGRGIDTINNIEQVSQYDPTPGSFILRVKGSFIIGSQDYALVFRTESNQIKVLTPFGGEKYRPGQSVFIQWKTGSNPAGTMTIEYSSDGGSNWSTIGTKSSTEKALLWTIPNDFTHQAKIRVSTSSSMLISGESGNFHIAPSPSSLTVLPACLGYAAISFNAVSGADGYKVYKKLGSEMIEIFDTNLTSFNVGGMDPNIYELVSVATYKSSGALGERALGIFVKADAGVCPWTNDLNLKNIVSPSSGRKFTSTALTNLNDVSIEVQNLGNSDASNFNVYYKINGGSEIIEPFVGTIASGATQTHTFTTKANLANSGSYSIECGIHNSPDAPYVTNNVKNINFKQLENDPITLATILSNSFNEGFENATSHTENESKFGLDGIDRFDFNSNNIYGRLRSQILPTIPFEGQKAITLDSKSNGQEAVNELIMTANLVNYSTSTHQVKLNLQYLNHGASMNAGNQIWVRGADNLSWINVYDLEQNQNHTGEYKLINGLNITKELFDHGQNFSESFQIKYGQQGDAPVTSIAEDQGYTFDQINLYLVNNDLELSKVNFPAQSSCNLSSNKVVNVKITNTVNNAVNGTELYYRLNNGPTLGPISVGNIVAYGTIDLNLPSMNLSAAGNHHLKVWISNTNDSYKLNDTILDYTIHNAILVSTFPYLETFEGLNLSWNAYGSNNCWVKGSPSKTRIKNAANGSQAWVTNLGTNYSANSISYLESPCFDLTGLNNPKLSFSFARHVVSNSDLAWVEVSDDGLTWQKLGSSGTGTNWYNNAGQQAWDGDKSFWHVATCPIPVLSLASINEVKFRIVFFSDLTSELEGIAIDDFHIYEGKDIATGTNVSATNTPSQIGWTPFYNVSNQIIASLKPNNNQDLGITDVNQYYFSGTPPRHDATQYYLNRNFTINPENPLNSGTVQVRLFMKDDEVNAIRTAPNTFDRPIDAYELGVTKISSDNDDGIFANEVGESKIFISYLNIQTTPYEDGYFLEFEVDGFSEFYINTGGISNSEPLPLTLVNFNIKSVNKTSIQINYELKDLKNIASIILECSQNPLFNQVEELQANHVDHLDYFNQIANKNVEAAGSYYFRLKYVNKNGSVEYSIVKKILIFENYGFIVTPNPFLDDLNVQFSDNLNGTSCKVNVYNYFNQRVYSHQFNLNKNNINIKLPKDLNSGIYYVEIIINDKKNILKIIKL